MSYGLHGNISNFKCNLISIHLRGILAAGNPILLNCILSTILFSSDIKGLKHSSPDTKEGRI